PLVVSPSLFTAFASPPSRPPPLHDALPIYPEVGAPADIRYVLAWKPFPGFFAPFANLELVVNLGAGIDSLAGRADLPDVPIARLDRKSTRLNSSHVKIAYAVFCLQKQTNTY